jgi:hypothetical protein
MQSLDPPSYDETISKSDDLKRIGVIGKRN